MDNNKSQLIDLWRTSFNDSEEFIKVASHRSTALTLTNPPLSKNMWSTKSMSPFGCYAPPADILHILMHYIIYFKIQVKFYRKNNSIII